MNVIREDVKKQFLEMLRSGNFEKLDRKKHHGCAYATDGVGRIFYSPIGILAKAVKKMQLENDDFWGGGGIVSNEAIRAITKLEDDGLSFEEIANEINNWIK